jgi:hypothetical protein
LENFAVEFVRDIHPLGDHRADVGEPFFLRRIIRRQAGKFGNFDDQDRLIPKL